MPVIIEKKVETQVTAFEVIESMNFKNLAEFVSELGSQFEHEHAERDELAKAFTKNLTNDGCRFMAEIVANYHGSKQRGSR